MSLDSYQVSISAGRRDTIAKLRQHIHLQNQEIKRLKTENFHGKVYVDQQGCLIGVVVLPSGKAAIIIEPKNPDSCPVFLKLTRWDTMQPAMMQHVLDQYAIRAGFHTAEGVSIDRIVEECNTTTDEG